MTRLRPWIAGAATTLTLAAYAGSVPALADTDPTSETDAANIAPYGTATQSSTFQDRADLAADKAVDAVVDANGNPVGTYAARAISATAAEDSPWWELDLGAPAAVDSISVWSRTDCCPDRLDGAWVLSSTTPLQDRPLADLLADPTVAATQIEDAQRSNEIPVDGRARYVRVQLPEDGATSTLDLAEVQVLGQLNATAYATATQSSTHRDRAWASADNAIDGVTPADPAYADQGLAGTTRTDRESAPYWETQLGEPFAIEDVVLWGRAAGSSTSYSGGTYTYSFSTGSRLNDVWVFVAEAPTEGRSFTELQDDPKVTAVKVDELRDTATAKIDAEGRFVRVQVDPAQGRERLSLAEVEILGVPTGPANAAEMADVLFFTGQTVIDPQRHLWGTSPIRDDEGVYHLFSLSAPNTKAFDQAWRDSAVISEYVSENPEGPFEYKRDVVVASGIPGDWKGASIFNPVVTEVDGRYALFVSASRTDRFVQSTGMLVTDDLNGEWEWAHDESEPLIAPSSDPSFWTYNNPVNNAAFVKIDDPADETPYHLYFKSKYRDPATGRSHATYGLAEASQLEGPYTVRDAPVTDNSGTIEDAFAFTHGSKVFMVSTDNDGAIERGGGILFESTDGGNSFGIREQAFALPREYISPEKIAEIGPMKRYYGWFKFERPQILFDEAGLPEYMYMPNGISVAEANGTHAYILGFNKRLVGDWWNGLAEQ